MDIIRSGKKSVHTIKGRSVTALGNRRNHTGIKLKFLTWKDDNSSLNARAARHNVVTKWWKALVRNQAAHLSWRGEWLIQSLENCGRIRREPCGRNSRERQEMAKESKGMRYSVSKSMVGSACFAGFSVGGLLQLWLG